jgi:hypothetical protein
MWALVALTVASVSCSGTTTGSYYYYDPYLYSYYYPADLTYSTYYYTDAWLYSDLYYYYQPEEAVRSAAQTDSVRWTVGTALRALARGDTVCPGQVTVTPKKVPAACSPAEGAMAMIPGGTTIMFNGCQIMGGGTIDGLVDVTATHTASEPNCSSSTMITVSHTTTITNLSYKGADGSRWLIPNLTDTGTNTYTYGQAPGKININSTGRFQYYDAGNNLLYDQNFNGTRSFKFASSQQGYNIDGVLNTQDNTSPTTTSMLTANGLTRSSACCHPTGGSLTLKRVTGSTTDQHTFEFGSSCGAAKQDGNSITLPACP